MHYRALRIIYKDDISSFHDLLKRDKSFTIHERNLQFLATEMFKVWNGLAPSFMDNIFPHITRKMSTRSNVTFYNPHNPKTNSYGLETLRELGPKIWNLIPESFKSVSSSDQFKMAIRNWSPAKCPCRMCKTYIPNLGFID